MSLPQQKRADPGEVNHLDIFGFKTLMQYEDCPSATDIRHRVTRSTCEGLFCRYRATC